MKSGPIILLEDDPDDAELFREALTELGIENKLIVFRNAGEAFVYLKHTLEQPFIIFSDVNLPRMNGIEFKRQLDADNQLRQKSIPFIFYSTSIAQKAVNEAYTQMTVQGFFKKPANFEEIKSNLKLIVDYWQACKHPNTT